MDTLEILKQKAELALSLQNAQADYQAALEQQAKTEEQSRLSWKLGEMTTSFDNDAELFKDELSLLETDIKDILAEITSIEQRVLAIKQNRDKLTSLASAIARIEVSLGLHNSQAKMMGYEKQVDQSFIDAISQEKLKVKFRTSNPLSINISKWQISELAAPFIGAKFWQNTGVLLYRPNVNRQEIKPEIAPVPVTLATDQKTMSVEQFQSLWAKK